jgi:predicted Na+-dependent transporter
MSGRNTTAMYLAIVAGIMLLVTGITGVAMIDKLRDIVKNQFGDNATLDLVFLILLVLASLGGIIVILGGVLIGKNKVGLGKFLITIGVGTGALGLAIALILYVKGDNKEFLVGGIVGIVGIVLSVAARMMAKKDESPPQQSQQQYPPQQQQYPAQQAYPQQAPQPTAPAQAPQQAGNACPSCGTPMRYIAQYQKWYCDICMKYA